MLPEVVDNMQVKVKEGGTSFWYDRRLASGPLCSSFVSMVEGLKIKDVWVDGTWTENKLVELVGLEKDREIMQEIIKGREGNDITIWKPAIDGKFSLSSAWDLI